MLVQMQQGGCVMGKMLESQQEPLGKGLENISNYQSNI